MMTKYFAGTPFPNPCVGTEEGKAVVLNGWKKAGIIGVLNKTEKLPAKDPFVVP